MATVGAEFGENRDIAGSIEDQTPRRTAADYLAVIDLHTRRNKESFLYPGTNYLFLKRFLDREQSLGDDLIHTFNFAHIQTYEPNGVRHSNKINGNQSLWPGSSLQVERPNSKDGVLVLLRGFPTPNWITEIGAMYKIDPEFFRRHMDFLKERDFYDLPTLQSGSRNMVKLKITTVCMRSIAINREQVLSARRREIGEVGTYQKKLDSAGESIFRRLSVQDGSTFTIEQQISCYIKRKKGANSGWTGIVWFDNGRDLKEGLLSPQLKSNMSGGTQNVCSPIFQPRPMTALTAQENDNILKPSQTHPPHSSQNPSAPFTDNTFQSSSLLFSQYGSSLDPLIAQQDPVYALNELFLFAANSECQFINFMASKIAAEMDTFGIHMMYSLQTLRYYKRLIDDHIEHLLDVVAFLKSSRRHTKSTDENTLEVMCEAQDSLIQDYENLVDRSTKLAGRCLEGASDITSKAGLEQSAQVIKDAQRVKRLTLLAFLILPLTLGTGVFGMNFREFGTGTLRIWVCFPVFLVITAISTIMAFPQVLTHFWQTDELNPSSSTRDSGLLDDSY